MNNKSFTAKEKQMLAEIEQDYKKWRTGNPDADNETTFKIGYLLGQAKGFVSAIKLAREI